MRLLLPSVLALLCALAPGEASAQRPKRGKATAVERARPERPPQRPRARPPRPPPSPPRSPPAPAAAPGPAAAVAGDASQIASKQDVAPAAAQAPLLRGVGGTPDERRQYEAASDAYALYLGEGAEYREEIQALVRRRYEEKRALLAQSYEAAIREVEGVERKQREDAIAQFEEFLARYPGHPRYTPEALYRLAELLYEQASDEHLSGLRAHEEAVRRIDPASGVAPPPEPQVRFGPSIARYRELLARFPDSALADAALYLLGYCLEKEGAFEEALASYRQLIRRFPRSKFAIEGWLRIGEHHFDSADDGALAKAAEAYAAATADPAHPLYDKALYKLGWTWYRLDRLDEAVEAFVKLASHYTRPAADGAPGGGDLLQEALQYTAISFADERWGSLQKARAYFEGLGGRSFEGDVYKRLGDVYFDQTRHADAIAAYRLALEKDPLRKDAPLTTQRIVQAYERDRRIDEAFTVAEDLAERYGPGTAWAKEHAADPQLVQSAQEAGEKSLHAIAIYRHQQALGLKQNARYEEAKASFEIAARSYRAYLARFPQHRSAYEMEFYLAECLYNSLQFLEAGRRYGQVRDSRLEIRFLADAAYSAVLAFQKQLEHELRQGRLPRLTPLRSADRKEGEKVVAVPLAEVEALLLEASDAFVRRLPRDPRAPGIAYKAAELLFAHNDFAAARPRFERIIETWPRTEIGGYAVNLLVEGLLLEEDWKSVEEVAGRLADDRAAVDPGSRTHQELVKFKLAARFKMGDQLLATGELDQAARKYLALVAEAPRHPFADLALNNAAVAHEKSRRFDSALRLYERLAREYPSSKLAGDALFRVAVNAENSYDFEKAVASYVRLVADYPDSVNREAALYNAARLLEAQQRYPEAAAAFLRYAELFPTAKDAAANQVRAALIYEKQDDRRGQISALEAFVQKFAADAAQAELVVDARTRIGEAWLALGEVERARDAFTRAADDYDLRRVDPEKLPLAADAAARARFQLAELELADFERLRIGGRGKALEESFERKREGVKQVNEAYARVFPYKRLEWTLAALFRRGYALERFAATIIETPVPPEVKRLGDEAVVAYQDMLAAQTTVLEDKAVESYALALAEARKHRLSNPWTRATLESLHRFRPKEYPVLKTPRGLFASDWLHPEGLLRALDDLPLETAPQKLTQEGDK